VAPSDEAPTNLTPGVIEPGDGGIVADIEGIVPGGGQRAVVVAGAPHRTLVAFLSSGCGTCNEFWSVFGAPGSLGLPPDTRVVIVTKGPENESPALVEALAPDRVPTIMTDRAWDDYAVPGSPYFVMVDGPSATVVGEGSGTGWDQVVGLLASAAADAGWVAADASRAPGRSGAGRLGGREREARADDELRAAGVHPGHESLYPGTVDDVHEDADRV
jgi:hypothetical protein